MALNKRKVLDAARKHAQKGAKAKALKEYNRLLKATPRDAKLLLEVGDAYRRWGQAEEAIAQYGKVAQQYRQDGFDARAVAVFKQILNLDPKHYSAYVSLAELYQRMGLDTEAISALQTAADGYQSEGRKADALDLLRQTAALDPTNTTSRLKVAELLRQEGMQTEALAEYKAVAEELETQQDRDQLAKIQERILELKPDEIETLSALVRNLMSSGDLVRAETHAVRALKISAEPRQYELLIELYAQDGDEAKLADATRGLAKLYRDRGDEEKARELMQRIPTGDVASSSRLEVDVSEIAEPELGDDELLDEEPFLSLTDEPDDVISSKASSPDEIDLELDAVTPAQAESAKPEVLPEGDPDQLLAEANVYLRYGKREQAIASLRGVIAQDPNHRAALEKLGEAFSDDGQVAEAVNAWKRAAVQVREAGDGEALAVLKDRIAALDPAAAEQIGSIEIVESKTAEVDLELKLDLDLDEAISEVSASESQASVDFDAGGDDFEIEIDDDPLEFDFETESKEPSAFEPSVEAAVSATPVASIENDTDELSLDLEMEPEDSDLAAADSADSASPGDEESEELVFDVDVDIDLDEDDASPSTDSTVDSCETATQKFDEELEEAEFYIAQKMFDEAEGIVARVLELIPDHPVATLRMGEIVAARGSRSEEATRESSSEAPIEDSSESPAGDDVRDFEEAARLDEADPPKDVEQDVEDATDSELENAVEPNLEASGDADSEENETFDLREALADVLADDEELESGNSSSNVLSTVEDGFGSIFSDFKKGVAEALEEGDYETRYDLGLAYREMGLYEDALGEFRICLDSEPRRFDSLYLMGICARDLSRLDESVNYFEQALGTAGIPGERLVGVYFDLSFAQEGIGEIERAIASVQKVLEVDAGFPGAQDRLAALEAGGASSPSLGEPGEVYESFDDLFEDDDEDGDVEMAQAVPTEAFESFDDVIEDAERVIESEQETSDPEADTQPAKKPGRKKISFV